MSEVKVDTISERTAANGVAVDGVTIKDSGLTIPSGGAIAVASGGDINVASGGEIDIASGATLDINGTADFTGATITGLSAGKILQVVIAQFAPQTSYIDSTSFSSTGGMSVSITPASASNNILVFVQDSVYLQTSAMHLYRIYESTNSAVITEVMCGTTAGGQGGFPNASSGYYNPSNTSELTFITQMKRMSGTSGSRMRDDQIDASGNVFHMIAMEIEG